MRGVENGEDGPVNSQPGTPPRQKGGHSPQAGFTDEPSRVTRDDLLELTEEMARRQLEAGRPLPPSFGRRVEPAPPTPGRSAAPVRRLRVWIVIGILGGLALAGSIIAWSRISHDTTPVQPTVTFSVLRPATGQPPNLPGRASGTDDVCSPADGSVGCQIAPTPPFPKTAPPAEPPRKAP